MSRANSSSAFKIPFAFCFVRKQYTPSADAMRLTVWPLFKADSAMRTLVSVFWYEYGDVDRYSVIVFDILSSPFTRISAFFRHRTAFRRRNVFFIFFFQKFEQVGDQRFFEKVAFKTSVDEIVD